MRVGLIGVLIAVLALPAAGAAQVPPATPTPTPTATPTPTPTPTPEELEKEKERKQLRKKKVVKSVYADFQRDGRIDACKHDRESLKMARRSIDSEFEQDFPDFRDAVTAAIKDHDKDKCEEEAEPTPTPTPSPTATPAPTTTPTPTTTPAPTTTPESGALGDRPRGRDDDEGGGAPPRNTDPPPPSEGDVAPIQPAPTPAPAAPAAPPEAQLVVTRPDGGTSLLLPALLLGGALLGLALAGASALVARRSGRLAGWGHAWREAAFRATGAWGDFSDWLRLGR